MIDTLEIATGAGGGIVGAGECWLLSSPQGRSWTFEVAPPRSMTSAMNASLPKHVYEIPDLRVVKVSGLAPPKYVAAQRGKIIKQISLASCETKQIGRAHV